MKRSVILILTISLLLILGNAFAGHMLSFTITHFGNHPHLKWVMDNEDNVVSYHVERSYDGVQFFDTEYENHVLGAPNLTYEWIDRTAFKQGTRFYYRVRVENIDGTHWHSQVNSIEIDNNGIQQTWGSLKALFR